jgi:hypothetical protein
VSHLPALISGAPISTELRLGVNIAVPRDPRADLACRAWQSHGDPDFQFVLLFYRQPAGTPSWPKLARPSIPSS